MPTYYTTDQIVARTHLTPQTVRSHLREKFPDREEENWWRIDPPEFEEAVAELIAGARVVPGQPRKGWHKIKAHLAAVEAQKRAGQTALFA